MEKQTETVSLYNKLFRPLIYAKLGSTGTRLKPDGISKRAWKREAVFDLLAIEFEGFAKMWQGKVTPFFDKSEEDTPADLPSMWCLQAIMVFNLQTSFKDFGIDGECNDTLFSNKIGEIGDWMIWMILNDFNRRIFCKNSLRRSKGMILLVWKLNVWNNGDFFLKKVYLIDILILFSRFED